MRIVAGEGDGFDFLEQVLHSTRWKNRGEVCQGVVDNVTDRFVFALQKEASDISSCPVENPKESKNVYNGSTPHEVYVVVLDLVLYGKKFGDVYCPLKQFLMDRVHIDLLHNLVFVQPIYHVPEMTNEEIFQMKQLEFFPFPYFEFIHTLIAEGRFPCAARSVCLIRCW